MTLTTVKEASMILTCLTVYEKFYFLFGMDEESAKRIDKEFKQQLQDRLNDVKQNPLPYTPQKIEEEWHHLRRSVPKDFDKSPDMIYKIS